MVSAPCISEITRLPGEGLSVRRHGNIGMAIVLYAGVAVSVRTESMSI